MRRQILILNPVPQEADLLLTRAKKYGTIVSATTLENAISHLEAGDYHLLIVDISFGRYALLKGLLRPITSILVTGKDEETLRQVSEEWPADFYVDTFLFSASDLRNRTLDRAFERAVEHAGLKKRARELKFAVELQEAKVRDVFAEIEDIKGLINANFLKEIEKRIAIEAKYVWFQKERQKVETVLRKIYASDDVSSLLGIVPDIKDILQASGTTIYIVEENEALGKYLKPIVWDNSYLTHADFSKYIALLDSQDFAATVARYGSDLSLSDLTFDRRMSKRYTEYLKIPLQSLLGVPIMFDREVIGVIEVYNKTVKGKIVPGGFSRQDLQILRGLTEHLAIAMTKLNLIQYDALTGLLRPDPFFDKLLQKINTLSKRRQEEGAHALAMGDVDWFKNYNDRNGQEAGNKLLRDLAQVLKMSIREEDLLCRYGGEEFLFYLTSVKGIDEAAHLTERIRRNVEDYYFEHQEFQPRNNLTMSFGVTIFPKKGMDYLVPMSKADLKKLAGEADLALAEAKGKHRAGLTVKEGEEAARTKNRVCLFSLEEAPKKKPVYPTASGEELFQERRKYERYNVSTLLMFDDSDGFKVAKTVNISLGGARIISENRLPLAKTMDTMLVLGDKADLLKGDVVYSEKAEGETSIFYSGMKFQEMTFREIKSLEDYLFNFRRRGFSSA